MTLTFSPQRAVVMAYLHTKVQGQRAPKIDWKQTDEQTAERTDARRRVHYLHLFILFIYLPKCSVHIQRESNNTTGRTDRRVCPTYANAVGKIGVDFRSAWSETSMNNIIGISY